MENQKNKELEQRRELLKSILEKKKKNSISSNKIEILNRKEGRNYFLSSFEQKRLWFTNQLDPNSIAYNIHLGFKIYGDLKLDLLQEAIKEIAMEQESLRTRFQYIDDELIQIVEPNFTEKIKCIDLSSIDIKNLDNEIEKAYKEESYKPFDLENGPLVRFLVIKINPKERIFITVIHHIIFDGWSMGIFYKSLSEKYNKLCNGEHLINKEKTVQYADYAKYQRKDEYKNKIEKQYKYWEKKIKNIDSNVEFPTDKKRPSTLSNNGDVVFFNLDSDTITELKKYSSKNNFTINTILLAAFKCLIYKYTNQNNISVGTVVANRKLDGIEHIIGFFVNTLVLSTEIDGDMNFLEVLEKVRATTLEAYDNEDIPFNQLVEAINPVRDSSRNPFFQLMFTYQNNKKSKLKLENLRVEEYALGSERSSFDLTLQIQETEDGIFGAFEYNSDLFFRETIKRISKQFELVVKQVLKNNLKVNKISLLDKDEKSKILVEFNDTDVDYPKNSTMKELFEEQVRKTPNNVAIVYEKEKLTYKTLNDRANALGEKLRKAGVKANDFVAIMTERSLEMVIGILGIIKAGGAYVPIDPKYPEDRIKYILSDCSPKIVLTYKASVKYKENSVIDLSDNNIFKGVIDDLKTENKPDDLLYLIYTSGTTGKPKGVMIKHKNIVNYCSNNEKSIAVSMFNNKLNNMASVTNMSFDIFATEILLVFANGMTTFIANSDEQEDANDLISFIERNNIEILQTTPSRIKILLSQPEKLKDLNSLKYIMVGGEKVENDIVNKLHQYTNAIVENVYGPSETTVWSTANELSRNIEEDNISIGKPIANTQIYILQGLNLCGIGIPGELCIAGDGVAKGYLNRPELTAEKFIDNPYGEGNLYRTGDLARWLPDGKLEYLGRIDEQVKIRGFRIELGEIANVLRRVEYISDVAVVTRKNISGEELIYSYIVSDRELDLNNIKREIRKELPEYMIPSYMMQIKEIPVNRNGKLDKRALPDILQENKNEYIAPRSDLEKIVVGIFEEVMGIDKISVNTDFFEIGGHSLRATKVANRIEVETGVRIPIKIVFSEKTAEAIAKYIADYKGVEDNYIKKAEEKECYSMSSAQRRIYLIWKMDRESTVYNMPMFYKLEGNVRVEDLKKSLQNMIDRYEILRTCFVMEDGEFVQKVLEKVEADYSYEESSEKISDIIKNFVKPFALDKGNLVRMNVVKDNDQFYLLIDMHHIVSDGMSIGIFLKEFSTFYNGGTLEEFNLHYKDYSEWIIEKDLSEEKEYWVSKFEDEIPVIDLPYDYKRPFEKSYEGAIATIKLKNEIKNGIEELCKTTGATEYMVLLAAFIVVLNKYTRQEDIVVGTPISGRTNKDMESMLGMFVNTLAIRERVESEKSFINFVNEVKENCIKAYENQLYPFEELVEAVELRRDFSRNPLFDVMFSLQNNEKVNLLIDDVKVEEIWGDHIISKFDLSIIIDSNEEGYLIGAEYSTSLFTKETIDRFLLHYKEVLYNIINNPEVIIGEIKVITKDEEELILNVFNDTYVKYNKEKIVSDMFEEQVKKTPNNIAVVYENEKLTYKELNDRSNALAVKLREVGVGVNDFVAIITERSLEMVIGILGVIKAGGAYVPIDPKYPEERIQYILSDCNPKAVLTYKNSIKFGELLVIDLGEKIVFENKLGNLTKVNKSEDLLYLIYTSGTTGKPKGVMVKHSNMINYCLNNDKSALEGVFKRKLNNMGSVTNMSFDIFGTEIIWVLVNGMTTFVANSDEQEDAQDLISFIERNKIEILQTTQSRIKILLSKPGELQRIDSLRYVIVGGEVLESNLVRNLYEYTDVVLKNAYGPSETTIISTSNELSRDGEEDNFSIGKPITNTQVYILQSLNLCGIGVAGELCIAGDGVAKGYLNNRELTEEKFIDNPFGDGKLYRTGDLARWLPDGNLQYLGRIDEQVKIRGFRIELEEIENVLRRVKNIYDAVVIARENSSGEKAIYSYVVSDKELDLKDIKSEIGKELPDYMIPSYMMQIKEIPVNRNGKLDKQALPNIVQEIKEEYIAPRNQLEKIIVEIFEEVTGLDRISVNTDFFEIGGHSLSATKAANRIESETGVRIPIKIIFSEKTSEGIARYVEESGNKSYNFIKKSEYKEHYKMSSAQKRLYLIWEMEKDSTAYNIPIFYKLNGKVSVERIEKAFQEIIDRHEILRTRFIMKDGELVQEILDKAEAEFLYQESKDDISSICKDFIKPFVLDKGNSIRIKVVNNNNKYYLLIDMHHIVSDGMSMGVFFKEFSAIYNEETLEEPILQYKDYSEWMNGKDLSDQKEYWVNKFKDEVPVINLPYDYSRPTEQSYDGSVVIIELQSEIRNGISKICKLTGSTEYMIFLSAFMIVLNKYTSQDDIVVGTPISGRTNKDMESLMGVFINTLAIRENPQAEKKFIEFANEVKEGCLKAYENQEYPFEELVEEVEVRRDISRNPLFDVMFGVQNNENVTLSMNEVTIEPMWEEHKVSKFDLNVMVEDHENGYLVCAEYCTALFKKDTIDRLLIHFKEVLYKIINNPEILIGEIQVITKEEENLILNTFNDTYVEYDTEKTLVHIFEKQVEKTPDNIAVVFEKEKITYKELNEKANSLARILQGGGISPDSVVGIITERSINMIVGIMAIIKAGGAYLPIDPGYPENRIEYIIKNSGTKVVLAQGKFREKVKGNLDVYDLDNEELYTENSSNLELPINKNNLAYVIYTSGTTGNPKGVMIEHESIVNRINWMQKKYNINSNDVILQKTTYTFDVSVWEIFWWSFVGATVKMLVPGGEKDPNIIAKNIKEGNVTIIHFVPSMFNAFIEYVILENRISDISNLKTIFTSGEELKLEQSNLFYEKIGKLNNTRLVNLYGPTEAAVDVTYYDCQDNEEVVPIGKPIDNIRLYIVDKNRCLVPVGVSGELCISGIGLARGYLNNGKLTAEKFIDNPYELGEKMYRTGDLARWLPDGNIEYLGRIDHQVKIRGFRIELGEIESSLLKINGIKEAVVIDRDKEEAKYLCSYYVAEKEYSIGKLREELKESLPEYMIPSYFIKLDKIPLTSNGKINRKSLPEPDWSISTGIEYEAPRSEVEKALVGIWKGVLGIKNIGINDDFFSLGGDSIKSIQVISRAKARGYYFEVKDLFKYSTIKELSKNIKNTVLKINQDEVVGEVNITPIQKWFFEMNFEKNNHWNQAMMIFSEEGFDRELIEKSFDAIVSHHDALRMTYKNENNKLTQVNRTINEKLYDLYMYSYENIEEVDDIKIKEICNKIQSSISLEEGPLVKLGLFKTNKGDHLLIAIHHLVIDGVSWRILFEDLQQAYMMLKNGGKAILPEKTTSFKEWASKQSEYANTYNVSKELEYWKDVEEEIIDALKKDKDLEESKFQDLRNIGIELTNAETEKLLKYCNRAYNTEINDILLATLSLTLSEWTGKENTLINLESHGREEIIKDVDITRTIGWFTSQYPVILKNNYSNLDTLIKNTKDLLRRIPNKGIGYGMIKYLSNDEIKNKVNFNLKPEICFNYLGQFDEDINNSLFKSSYLMTGESISLFNRSLYSLDFSAIVEEGKLKADIIYSNKEYNEETIKVLARNYKNNLIKIINHCIDKKEIEKTASDITKENISLNDLSPYLKDINNIKNIYPLSPMQEGMLYHTLADESEAYHEVLILKIKGELDIDVLEMSFNKLIERHDILRTTFDNKNFNKNMQIVFNEIRTKIEYEDISETNADKEAYINGLVVEDKKNKFNLENDVLIRLKVVKEKNYEYSLIISNHHIILDGWCLSILITELFKLYNELKYGYEAKLKEVSQYSDYIEWINSKDNYAAEDYWKNYLLDFNEVTEIPFKDSASTTEYKNSEFSFILEEEITRKLEGLAKNNKVTVNTMIQSLWATLLQKYNNSNDIVFGYVVSGRNPEIKGIENMLGLFINTIPLRVKLEDNMSFRDLIININNSFVESNEYDYYPLSKIQQYSETREKLINNIMIFENYPVDNDGLNTDVLGRNNLEIVDFIGLEQTNYNFNIAVVYQEIIQIKFQFNELLYSKDNVEKIKNHFLKLVKEVVSDENVLIKDIEILEEDERNKVLVEFNDTRVEYPTSKTIQELFEEKVIENPNNIALELGNEKVTYKELNEKANSLAYILRSKKVIADDIIGVMIERSTEMIVAIIAILKAGGAYLPIDPTWPKDRIEYILNDSSSNILLSTKKLKENIEFKGETIDLLNKDLFNNDLENPEIINGAVNLAYVIYTSGTTGKPKGVMVTHSSLKNFINSFASKFSSGFGVEDKVLSLTNYVFDVSVCEFFVALTSGATLIINNNHKTFDVSRITRLIVDNNITFTYIPPSLLQYVYEELKEYRDKISLNKLLVGVESIRGETLRNFYNLNENLEIVNGYGPTESTICSTFYKVSGNEMLDKAVPIGKPLDNLRVYILDDLFNILPIGIFGEICISGIGLARGYLNNEELTEEKFVENPYESGEKMYRTGDLARWLPDGNIEFLGRIDNQVKIRGFRVELGEVESNLLEIDGIKEVIAIDKERENSKYLCSYYVAEMEYNILELREKLKASLPEYMIPSYFIKLDKIPLTPNGKVDRKSLPEPEWSIGTGVEYEEPRNEVELVLAEIWQGVLGVKIIGINDDFFSLGGDSIKSIQVISRAKSKGYYFEVKDLFKYSTIKELSSNIKNTTIKISQDEVVGDVELTPIQKWFFDMDFESNNHWNQSMMLFSKDGFDKYLIEKSFDAIITHHDALRMSYIEENGIIKQINRGKDGNLYDLSVYDWKDYEDINENELEVICSEIQGSISLEEGPLVKLGLFKTGKGDHLLIAIHHLVIDGVSWRILFEDLEKAYIMAKNGEKIILQEKTTSFKEWATKQKEYSDSYNAKKKLDYWNTIESQGIKKICKDKNKDKATLYSLGNIRETFTKEMTEKLLKYSNKTYNTEINDILLSALSLTISDWTGAENTLINLESHGREDIINDVDITRTIGWFTSQYPVILKKKYNDDLGMLIKRTKDLLRRIPNKGIDYGIIKYLSNNKINDKIEFKLMTEISFNYLGEFDGDINNSIFNASHLNQGKNTSLNNRILYSLDFIAILEDKELVVNIRYSSNEYNYETIKALAETYKSNLIKIINHCLNKEDIEKTATDITKENISLDELKPYLKDISNIKNIYPLTPMQEGMLYHTLLDDSLEAYHQILILKIKGYLDIDILEESFNKLIARHDILRTIFDNNNFNKNMQIVFNERKTNILYKDISEEDIDKEAYINNIIAEEKKNKFKLYEDVLIRLNVIKVENDTCKLILSNHHIILDGWCVGILIFELFKLYSELKYGYKSELKEAVQYSNYIEWLKSKDDESAEGYWSKYLLDYNEVTEVPFKNNIKTEGYKNNYVDYILDEGVTKKLEKIAKNNKVTVNTIIQSLWAVLLKKYNNSNDVVFGYVVSGRNPEVNGIENMLGLFINTIPLRVKLEDNMSFKDLLIDVNSSFIESNEHDYYPLAHIQSLSEVKDKLINNIMIFENYPVDNEGLNNDLLSKNELEIVEFGSSEQTNYDFNITVNYQNIILIKFQYNELVYSNESIERIKSHFISLVNEITTDESILVKDMEILGEHEKNKILLEFNDTAVDYPKNNTIQELFEEQVRKTPNNVAVVYEKEKLTYKELNDRANALGDKLRETGVKANDFVAIMTERSLEMVIGILGIIKAGGAYVPIDPKYPEERINYILSDCNPKAILTYKANINLYGVPVIGIDDDEIIKYRLNNLSNLNKPDDLLYLIYTSGTTGNPKGVMIKHRNMVNYCSNNKKSIAVSMFNNNLNNMASVTNMSFDIFATEILLVFLNGMTTFIANSDEQEDANDLISFIERNNIEILQTTPSRIKILLSQPEKLKDLNSLKYIMVGGEKVENDIVNKLHQYTNAIVENVYGPSETTVWSTANELSRNIEEDNISIGKPIANTQIYILQGLNLCGIGIPGELCISGDGVAKGYLNRPELTAEKFIDNPYGEGNLYRTGDLARWLPDGKLEYLGRIDEQVKIRGFRIELGEITNVLCNINEINNAAVIARENSSGEKAIYAYVVSDKEIDLKSVKQEIRKELLEYMIPSYMMQINEIPVNRNGKLDKRALPDILQENTDEYIAPRSDLEKIVVRIFEEVIGIDKISVNTDFFEIGGHSLRATKVVNRIEAETGVRIPIKIIFSEKTAEFIAKYIVAHKEVEDNYIKKAEEKEYYPMSSAQRRIYLIWQMDRESTAYNMPMCYKLEGKVRLENIKDSLQRIINRHEVLRTCFVIKDGEPVQKVLDKVEIDYSYEKNIDDISITLKDFIRPFELDKGNLVRIKVIENKKQYYLLIDMHHIVSDGMSMGIFINEFSALYNGEILEEPVLQYKDYSEWMSAKDLKPQKEYWISQFEEEEPIIDIPYDYKRPIEQSHEGEITSVVIDSKMKNGIKELCKTTGATEYMMLLAAFMVTLNKYTRQEDIVVGTPISGRTNKDMESMMGVFVNTLAIREKPKAGKTFIEFVNEVKESSLKAYENQEYPFEELVESVEVRRDFSRNPLFDVMFSLGNNEKVALSLDDVKLDLIYGEHRTSKFDFSIVIESNQDEYFVLAEYCTALFKKETMNKFLIHFKEVLCKVIDTPEILIGEIQVITKEEENLILNKFNDTDVKYDKEKTIVDIFEEQVRKTPNNIAVVYEKESLTYKELNERANIVGGKLREIGIKPDDFVAIVVQKSLEMIVGILGIIKAGGAYVPIDPKYPEDRINYIISDCNPKAIVTYKVDIKVKGIKTIDLTDNKTFEGEPRNLDKVNSPNDLLYVIYTSGTTGKPKGVMIEHKAVNSLREYFINSLKVNQSDRVLQFSNISFDASVWDITMALLTGATLNVVNQDKILDTDFISNYVKDTTIMLLPPQHYQQLKTTGQRLVITGGSESNKDVVEKAIKQCGAYLNAYGPTEVTVLATNWFCNMEDNLPDRIPIGKPIDNKKVYICDNNRLCGIGIPGELCISGDGISRGYLNNPELTAEKFVENPFGEGKLYKSGDLARWLPDGNLEYLGRIDEQVKVRGFRIELGEIENVLRKINHINDAAVITRENSVGEKAIYAYVVSDMELDINKVKNEIHKELPDYMVPSYMMQIKEIPLNRSGKLDKRALPDIIQESKEEYIAPRNEKEKIICNIVSRVLEVKNVGLQDNFFGLGGDSLKLLRLISELRKEGFNVTFNTIKNCNNIKMLVDQLYSASSEYIEENAISINKIMVPIKINEDFISSSVYKELIKYNMNVDGAEKYNEYHPLSIQLDFLNKKSPSISSLGIEIIGKLSKESILKSIKDIINSQATLRTIYNIEDNTLTEISRDDWYIPYFGKTQYEEAYNNLGSIFKYEELFKARELLSKVIVIEKDDSSHLVFFYANHAIWDFMTSEILVDIIRNRLLNSKESFLPDETYYEYVNRKRNNSKEVKMYDSIENIEENVENYKSRIRQNYNYVNSIILTKEINELEKREILNNPIKWLLDRYYKIIDIKEITQIPFTMVHIGRESKTLNTLGLYADTIPCLYDISNEEIKGWEEEKANIISNESHQLYKENVPRESNIFTELSVNVIISDSNSYHSDIKSNSITINGPCNLEDIPEDIYMYIGKNDLEVYCPVYATESEENDITKKIKKIFNMV